MGILINIFPEISVLLLVLAIIMTKLLSGSKKATFYGWMASIWLTVTAVLIYLLPSKSILTWGGMYFVDAYASYFKIIIIITAVLVNLSAMSYVDRIGYFQTEFFAILNAALLGMMIFSAAGDLTTFYLGLELMTISFIILICFVKRDNLATEGGLKYLILSGLSSAIMLFGMSIIYGTFGTTMFVHISQATQLPIKSPYFVVGLMFFLSGFAFKLSAVPFHMWAPDIYQAAPTPVAGFLAVGSKAATLAVMARLFLNLFPSQQNIWGPVVLTFALLSVIFGNLMAIPQKDVKRMLAYSSIAQVGYLLLGILAGSQLGIMSMMYYLGAYIFANVGAFIVAGAWEENTGSTWRDDYSGMSKRSPLLAAAMFVFLVSLGGLPPMAGFIGKFLLFTAAIQAQYLVTAIVALIMSMISVYYYFQIIRAMYITKPNEGIILNHISLGNGIKLALIICMVMTVVMGLLFGPIMHITLIDSASAFLR